MDNELLLNSFDKRRFKNTVLLDWRWWTIHKDVKISSWTASLTSMDAMSLIYSQTSANISITRNPFSISLESLSFLGLKSRFSTSNVYLRVTNYFLYLVIHSKIFQMQQQGLSYLYSQVKFGAHILHRTKPKTQQKSGVNRLLQDQSSSVTGITLVCNERFWKRDTQNRNTPK